MSMESSSLVHWSSVPPSNHLPAGCHSEPAGCHGNQWEKGLDYRGWKKSWENSKIQWSMQHSNSGAQTIMKIRSPLPYLLISISFPLTQLGFAETSHLLFQASDFIPSLALVSSRSFECLAWPAGGRNVPLWCFRHTSFTITYKYGCQLKIKTKRTCLDLPDTSR